MCTFILHCWLLSYYTNILWDATTLQCRLIGATQILEQISENEQERLFELERKDQENIQMQKYLEKLMEEDRNKLEKKAAEQHLLRVYTIFTYHMQLQPSWSAKGWCRNYSFSDIFQWLSILESLFYIGPAECCQWCSIRKKEVTVWARQNSRVESSRVSTSQGWTRSCIWARAGNSLWWLTLSHSWMRHLHTGRWLTVTYIRQVVKCDILQTGGLLWHTTGRWLSVTQSRQVVECGILKQVVEYDMLILQHMVGYDSR